MKNKKRLFAVIATAFATIFILPVTAKDVSTGLEVRDVYADGNGSAEKVVRRANEGPEFEATGKVSDVKVQITSEEAGKRSIRFVAGVDSNDYDDAGFNITIKEGTTLKKTYTAPITKVYTSIQAEESALEAKDIFGEDYNYLFVYAITDVPATAYNWVFMVSAYIANNNLGENISDARTTAVQDIIYKDNSEVNTLNITEWNPYNGTWASFRWSNNVQVQEAVNIPLLKTVNINITDLISGNRYNLNPDREFYNSGYHAVLQNPAGYTTVDNDYIVTIMIVTNDDVAYYGEYSFVRKQLPEINLNSINITEDYVLTFTGISNVSKYTIVIYNDEYESKSIDFISGNKLPVAELEIGVYSIEITAVPMVGYLASVTIIEDAFIIEQGVIIEDGNSLFKLVFDRSGRGIAWETTMHIAWIDSEFAVTKNNIFDFEFYDGATLKTTQLINWGGINKDIYASGNDYRSIAFMCQDGWSGNDQKEYTIKFFVETDDGSIYRIEKTFRTMSSQGDIWMYQNNYQKEIHTYINLLNKNSYSSSNWTLISNLRLQALTDVDLSSNPQVVLDNMKTEIALVPEAGLPLLAKTSWTAIASSGTAQNGIDGNIGSRWESASTNEQWIIIDMKNIYDVHEIIIDWEAASSKEFIVELSVDEITSETPAPETFADAVESTSLKKVTNTVSANHRIDSILFPDGVQARYIRVYGYSRTTNYGHSFFELDVRGQ